MYKHEIVVTQPPENYSVFLYFVDLLVFISYNYSVYILTVKKILCSTS